MGGELQTKRSRLRAVAPKGNHGNTEPNHDTASENALTTGIIVAQSKLQYLAGLSPETIDENSLYKVSNALSGLVRGLIELRRFEMERAGAIVIAHKLLVEKVQNHLRANPELAGELQKEITAAVIELE